MLVKNISYGAVRIPGQVEGSYIPIGSYSVVDKDNVQVQKLIEEGSLVAIDPSEEIEFLTGLSQKEIKDIDEEIDVKKRDIWDVI